MAKLHLYDINDFQIKIQKEFTKYHKNETYDEEIIDLFSHEKTHVEDFAECDLLSLPYDTLQYLFKKQVDVFQLIETGDALAKTI